MRYIKKVVSHEIPFGLVQRIRRDYMYVDILRVRDLEQCCRDGYVQIVDLRSRSEYETSHIPYAVNIPYEEMDDYIDDLSRWDKVIFYCSRGNLSLMAARELSKISNGMIYSLGGGYNAYQQYYGMYNG